MAALDDLAAYYPEIPPDVIARMLQHTEHRGALYSQIMAALALESFTGRLWALKYSKAEKAAFVREHEKDPEKFMEEMRGISWNGQPTSASGAGQNTRRPAT